MIQNALSFITLAIFFIVSLYDLKYREIPFLLVLLLFILLAINIILSINSNIYLAFIVLLFSFIISFIFDHFNFNISKADIYVTILTFVYLVLISQNIFFILFSVVVSLILTLIVSYIVRIIDKNQKEYALFLFAFFLFLISIT